jgi:hypothetical protein
LKLIRAIAITLVFFFPAAAGFTQIDKLVWKSGIDWEKGKLTLEVSLPLDLESAPFPKARAEAERRIEGELTGLLVAALENTALDSGATVGEFLTQETPVNDRHLYLEALTELSTRGLRKESIAAADFRTLTVVYEYSFYGNDGLLTPLVRHARAFPLPASLGFQTTREFSGIVIYARGDYQSFGTDKESPCTPAFFPKIFYLSDSGTIEPVLEKQMVDPNALKRSGMLSYAYQADSAAYAARAGSFPLTIAAFMVYGNNNTDLVISEDSARMLLSNEKNRALLREGKIVVVIDRPNGK